MSRRLTRKVQLLEYNVWWSESALSVRHITVGTRRARAKSKCRPERTAGAHGARDTWARVQGSRASCVRSDTAVACALTMGWWPRARAFRTRRRRARRQARARVRAAVGERTCGVSAWRSARPSGASVAAAWRRWSARRCRPFGRARGSCRVRARVRAAGRPCEWSARACFGVLGDRADVDSNPTRVSRERRQRCHLSRILPRRLCSVGVAFWKNRRKNDSIVSNAANQQAIEQKSL